MNQLAKDYKDKDVVSYVLYTREPHAGQNRGREGMDFSEKKQTATHEERVDYAKQMLKDFPDEKRDILIDTFGPECIQIKYGAGRPNSLLVIDKKGKLVLWQEWANPEKIRAKLNEMIAGEKKDETEEEPKEKAEKSEESK